MASTSSQPTSSTLVPPHINAGMQNASPAAPTNQAGGTNNAQTTVDSGTPSTQMTINPSAPSLVPHSDQQHITSSSSGHSSAAATTLSSTTPLTGPAVSSGAPASPPPQATSQNATSGPRRIPSPSKWVSIWLRWWFLLSMCIFTLGFIGAIIGLCIHSKNNDGIRTVNLSTEIDPLDVPNVRLGVSLSWTLVPVFLTQIYVLTIAAVVNQAGDRQRYVELRRDYRPDTGAAAQKSIFLDYLSYWTPWAAVKALWYNHYVLAYGFGTSIVVNLFLTSLAAHLFYTSIVPIGSDTSLDRTYYYNEFNFGGRSDLTPILSITKSTKVYHGHPIPWTTLEESILHVSLDNVPRTNNITLQAHAYSARLDCRSLNSPYEFELGRVNSGWAYSVSDRGCNISNKIFIGLGDAVAKYVYSYSLDWVQTYSELDCGPSANYTRLVLVAATTLNISDLDTNSFPSKLYNKTAVSCIPSYYRHTGDLSLSVNPAKPKHPGINEFTPTSTVLVDPRPAFSNDFETQLLEPGVIDDTETVKTNDFGRVIYDYAGNLSPRNYLEGKILAKAMEDIFTSAFAVMANQFLVQPAPTPTQATARYYVDKTRLIVVQDVAYAMLAILSAVLVMLIWVAFYTWYHPSIQYEGTRGLIGAAAILRNSDLMHNVEQIDANTCNGEVAKQFEDQSSGVGWRFDGWDNPATARISSVTIPKQYGLPFFRRRP